MSAGFDIEMFLPPGMEVTLEKIFLVPPLGATRHLTVPVGVTESARRSS